MKNKKDLLNEVVDIRYMSLEDARNAPSELRVSCSVSCLKFFG